MCVLAKPFVFPHSLGRSLTTTTARRTCSSACVAPLRAQTIGGVWSGTGRTFACKPVSKSSKMMLCCIADTYRTSGHPYLLKPNRLSNPTGPKWRTRYIGRTCCSSQTRGPSDLFHPSSWWMVCLPRKFSHSPLCSAET